MINRVLINRLNHRTHGFYPHHHQVHHIGQLAWMSGVRLCQVRPSSIKHLKYYELEDWTIPSSTVLEARVIEIPIYAVCWWGQTTHLGSRWLSKKLINWLRFLIIPGILYFKKYLILYHMLCRSFSICTVYPALNFSTFYYLVSTPNILLNVKSMLYWRQ